MSDAVIAENAFLTLPEISDSDAARLAGEIESRGVAVIPAYIDDATLRRLQQMVAGIVSANGGEYAALTGKTEISGTLLEQLGVAPHLVDLMRCIYEKACGQTAPAQSLYQVLRCLAGVTGLGHAYFFHYDSYVVTALLPIVIPQEGQTGDLVMKPNHRRLRGSYLANLADKILVDNKFAQRHFRKQAEKLRGGFVKVRIVPGNLYLFWGYRTLHANEPCDPKVIRATALFHFGDPHTASRLRRVTGRAAVRATAGPSVTPS